MGKENKVQIIKDKILEWVYANHDHHEFTDEELPKGVYGCFDRQYPYVNSIELEKFIKEIEVI